MCGYLLELLQGTGQYDQSHSNGAGQRQQYKTEIEEKCFSLVCARPRTRIEQIRLTLIRQWDGQHLIEHQTNIIVVLI